MEQHPINHKRTGSLHRPKGVFINHLRPKPPENPPEEDQKDTEAHRHEIKHGQPPHLFHEH